LPPDLRERREGVQGGREEQGEKGKRREERKGI